MNSELESRLKASQNLFDKKEAEAEGLMEDLEELGKLVEEREELGRALRDEVERMREDAVGREKEEEARKGLMED